MDFTRLEHSSTGFWLITPTIPGIFLITEQRSEDRDQNSVEIDGQGKDSKLRYGLRRITALASCCLKPLSHLPLTHYFAQPALILAMYLQPEHLQFCRLIAVDAASLEAEDPASDLAAPPKSRSGS
jgi:hypothetical protein